MTIKEAATLKKGDKVQLTRDDRVATVTKVRVFGARDIAVSFKFARENVQTFTSAAAFRSLKFALPLLALLFASMAHAGRFDASLDALFGPAPTEDAGTPSEEFGENWFDAFVQTGEVGELEADVEPIVLLSSEARSVAAAAPMAEGPVLPLEEFVSVYLNSTPAQRSKAMGVALKPLLKGQRNKDQVRDCSVHAGEIVADRVVGDFLFSREPASAEETADALVAGIGVCLGSADVKGAEIIAAFAEAISVALARPE